MALAQNSPSVPPLVTFTADEDHQDMMDQLGIKALRPGPSGDAKAPDHANYNESKANPYPNPPDPLTIRTPRRREHTSRRRRRNYTRHHRSGQQRPAA
jgi:hypothetical protein